MNLNIKLTILTADYSSPEERAAALLTVFADSIEDCKDEPSPSASAANEFAMVGIFRKDKPTLVVRIVGNPDICHMLASRAAMTVTNIESIAVVLRGAILKETHPEYEPMGMDEELNKEIIFTFDCLMQDMAKELTVLYTPIDMDSWEKGKLNIDSTKVLPVKSTDLYVQHLGNYFSDHVIDEHVASEERAKVNAHYDMLLLTIMNESEKVLDRSKVDIRKLLDSVE